MDRTTYDQLVHFMNFSEIKKQESCALVGTSSTLLQTYNGKNIDSFPFVIRVNGVPPEHIYESYTGIRDDLHIGTYPMNKKHKSKNRIIYCHIGWFPSTCWTHIMKDHVPRISPFFVNYVKTKYAIEVWPSSGLIAYEVANIICNKVFLFGFGLNSSFSNCSHYYNIRNTTNTNICSYSKKYGGKTNASPRNYENYVKTRWHDLARENRIWLR